MPLGSLQLASLMLDTLVVRIAANSQEPPARLDPLVSKLALLEQTLESLVVRVARNAAQAQLLIPRVEACGPSCMTSDTLDVPGSGRDLTVVVSSQQVITQTSTPLTSIDVRWDPSRWEVSAGLMASNLPIRSYENAPLIESGLPQLDSSNKVRTRVSMSETRPSILTPMVIVHYRAGSSTTSPDIAWLWSMGVGINVPSQSTEVLLGASLRVRRAVLSAGLHGGRDLRLRDGVTVGQELGSSPPALPTERYWTLRGGLALSVRVSP